MWDLGGPQPGIGLDKRSRSKLKSLIPICNNMKTLPIDSSGRVGTRTSIPIFSIIEGIESKGACPGHPT